MSRRTRAIESEVERQRERAEDAEFLLRCEMVRGDGLAAQVRRYEDPVLELAVPTADQLWGRLLNADPESRRDLLERIEGWRRAAERCTAGDHDGAVVMSGFLRSALGDLSERHERLREAHARHVLRLIHLEDERRARLDARLLVDG